MKCSVCGSTNMIKINEEMKGKYNIEYYACKDCCHVDTYCFDFKKNSLIEEKAHKILNGIKYLREQSLGNKKDVLRKYYDGLSLIRISLPSDEINEEIISLNRALKSIDEYLNVEPLLKVKEEDSYDDNFNAVKKDIYYIGDFPVNYKDCVNGPSIFFFKCKAQYKNLETIKNHTSKTTLIDIMNDYFTTEAKEHIFYNLNDEIKTKKWYLDALNNEELKDAINMINNAIIEFNK